MTVTVPSERLRSIELTQRDALTDIAIGLYKREQISLGRAAEIAGLSSPEFLEQLARRRIPINYEIAELREDVEPLYGEGSNKPG
jgi:predicted HTH domain antitoxin